MRPKVSLIVAAYNVEHYIQKCIKSLKNQTLREVEIIIVNDASLDNTLNKINEIYKEDERIIVIDKKNNEGVMRARETGFRESSGEYLLFVDGDDWLAENAAEVLYEKAKQRDYDIVCFNYFSVEGKNIKKSHYLREDNMVSGDKFLRMVMTNKINPPLWSKLIKRKFIIDNNVAYPNGIAKAQDLAFSCSLGIHSPRACILNEYFYYYVTSRKTSVTNSISSVLLEVEKAISFVKKQLISNNIFHKFEEEFEYLAYIHNFNKDLIYINRNKFSKQLYRSWRNMGINISKNKYFSAAIKREPLKARIIIKMGVRYYLLGIIFYKLYYLYLLTIRRIDTV